MLARCISRINLRHSPSKGVTRRRRWNHPSGYASNPPEEGDGWLSDLKKNRLKVSLSGFERQREPESLSGGRQLAQIHHRVHLQSRSAAVVLIDGSAKPTVPAN